MPPNLPTGWNIPQWLQVMAVVCFILTPITVVVLTFVLKDKRQLKNAEDSSLASGQASFIDKILKAAEMAPELLAKNEDLMSVNADLRATIKIMEDEISKLKAKVESLERDRDSWREMALKVPNLEAQLQTYDRLVRQKENEIESLREQLIQARVTTRHTVTETNERPAPMPVAGNVQEEP